MKRDLYTGTELCGNRWLGIVRLPWKAKPFYVCENGVICRYDDKAQAAQAASDVLCEALADRTTGFFTTPLLKVETAKSKAEALFNK